MKNSNVSTLRRTIDTRAISKNYRHLVQASNGAECGAAVKANAYGCGLERVIKVLNKQGCKHYFVADAHEAIKARELSPTANIYVLNGFWPECAELFATHNLTPIINSKQQLRDWQSSQINLPYILHIDTGMNRLGIRYDEAVDVLNNVPDQPEIIMSHFACSDTPTHPLNNLQLERFNTIRRAFPDIKASIANSAAVLSNEDTKYDLTRPGLAIYGANPLKNPNSQIQAAVTIESRVLDIKGVKAGETISYGATFTAKQNMTICICGIGYADGYQIAASGSGSLVRELNKSAPAFIHGHEVFPLGRVTMDFAMFDISHIPQNIIQIGDWIEIFGKNVSVDRLASAAGTISYEILTSFGRARHLDAI